MPDLRLPLEQAIAARLLPDLAPIRDDMRDDIAGAVLNLYGEMFENNPRVAFEEPFGPTCEHADLTEAQRALLGVYLIADYVAPWEWLSLLLDKPRELPLIVWAGRVAEIGKTGDFIEHLIRMNGGEPDALVAAYCKNPSASLPIAWEQKVIGYDAIRTASVRWWSSDGPGHADFNKRVFDFALRRLPELIALDEA